MTIGADLSTRTSYNTDTADWDVVIVGTGYAGLYALYHFRKCGFRVRAFDKAGGVGGTWYWNRYPGARVDIESMEYSYSFSESLQQEWSWSERYASQPELLRYLNHTAEKFDLLRDITLGVEIKAAKYDDERKIWIVTTDDERVVTCRYLIMATGILAAPRNVEFPGQETFGGDIYYTSSWPHKEVDFTGKRVAVIGTGSSGIQAIPVIAQTAGHLTVFQRSPNFAVPSCNKPMDPEFENWVKRNYAEIRERELRSTVGCAIVGNSLRGAPTKSGREATPEERRAAYEKCWNSANFSFYGVFNDVFVDKEVNDSVADFIRDRIRDRVNDPAIAELLTPRDYPVMTRRLCAETDYFETYNRDNVSLIDISDGTIDHFTPEGLVANGEPHDFDIVIFATGFDAMTGSMTRIDFRGRDGRSLRGEWEANGPRTYAGIMANGFPNLFMINGPTSPGAFFQPVLLGEWQSRWIARLLEHMEDRKLADVEPARAAEDEWIAHSLELASQTLFPQARSWYMGDNVPGKPRVLLSYIGGFPNYRARLEESESHDYPEFELKA